MVNTRPDLTLALDSGRVRFARRAEQEAQRPGRAARQPPRLKARRRRRRQPAHRRRQPLAGRPHAPPNEVDGPRRAIRRYRRRPNGRASRRPAASVWIRNSTARHSDARTGAPQGSPDRRGLVAGHGRQVRPQRLAVEPSRPAAAVPAAGPHAARTIPRRKPGAIGPGQVHRARPVQLAADPTPARPGPQRRLDSWPGDHAAPPARNADQCARTALADSGPHARHVTNACPRPSDSKRHGRTLRRGSESSNGHGPRHGDARADLAAVEKMRGAWPETA